jgi:hypothetical protein
MVVPMDVQAAFIAAAFFALVVWFLRIRGSAKEGSPAG